LLSKFEDFFQKRYLIPLHVANEENAPDVSEDIRSNDEDVDADALAYIKAKKKVDFVHKIKKQDKTLRK